jgi:ligand-binding sensor domain-containing protein
VNRRVLTLLAALWLSRSFGPRLMAQEWMVFTPENSSIPDRNVLSVAVDSSGVVWVGTRYEGMASFDGLHWFHYQPPLSGGGAEAFPLLRPAAIEAAQGSFGEHGPQAEAIYDIAIDSKGIKWIGTKIAGVKRFDGRNWTLYNSRNSPLPDDYAWSVLPDRRDRLWVGTKYGGLAVFDGTSWLTYNRSNSPLPSNDVTCLALHPSGQLWVGTTAGIAILDGQGWTVYTPANSGLPIGHVETIAFDASGTAWIGTWGAGLVCFDGRRWSRLSTTNSGLTDDYIYSLGVENNGVKWIGTFTQGVVAFDGQTWQSFAPWNSPLPDAFVYDLLIDRDGNKWFATTLGLAVYRKGGVILRSPPPELPPGHLWLDAPIPNPSSDRLDLILHLKDAARVSVTVYDALGRPVRYLVRGEQLFCGITRISWDGRSDSGSVVPTGIYLAVAQAGHSRSVARIVRLR